MSRGAAGSARLVVFIVVAGLMTAALVLYSMSQRRPPIPADGDHGGVSSAVECLTCHGPAEKNARGPNHPLDDKCFSCHEWS